MRCIALSSFILLYIIGFSLGDELGFPESLGNVEGNKRRSLNLRTGTNSIGVYNAQQQQSPKPTYSPPLQQNRPKALITPARYMPSTPSVTGKNPNMNILKMNTSPRTPMGTPIYVKAASNPTPSVPPFKPIPRTVPVKPSPPPQQMMPITMFDAAKNTFSNSPNFEIQRSQSFEIVPQSAASSSDVTRSVNTKRNVYPDFQSMPQSVSRISDVGFDEPAPKISHGFQPDPMPLPASTKLPVVDLMGHTVAELAAAANVSVEVLQTAINMRQQELVVQQQALAYQQIMATQKTSTTTTTTTTTTPRPTKRPAIGGGSKVMNAPREYYPVGYEKNFDDNFTSKVDLPNTTFHCGNQKHFPGLYADDDLGCMVFHVCALTDDGLIMKSFLCPESTLFDQTVLKCNWWFYVDCKSSKSLYDSNIPVSKSYQLMKALTFFSNYKTGQSEENSIDMEALKNTIVSENKST